MNLFLSRSSKTNMAKVRRKAEIEIFKLEREREINYVKAKSEHHNSTDKLNDQSDTASVASAKTDGEQNSNFTILLIKIAS